MKIKTIDVNALNWFDKINGNSYFAGTVTINYGMKLEKTYKMPFQYGYGDQYKHEAIKTLSENKILTDVKYYTSGGCESLHGYCNDHNIILRTSKTDAKKAELKKIKP